MFQMIVNIRPSSLVHPLNADRHYDGALRILKVPPCPHAARIQVLLDISSEATSERPIIAHLPDTTPRKSRISYPECERRSIAYLSCDYNCWAAPRT
jgi:hypothetical protein